MLGFMKARLLLIFFCSTLRCFINSSIFLQVGESVTKTLKRLGGKESAAEARKRRWEAKKAKKSLDENPQPLDAFTGEILGGLMFFCFLRRCHN